MNSRKGFNVSYRYLGCNADHPMQVASVNDKTSYRDYHALVGGSNNKIIKLVIQKTEIWLTERCPICGKGTFWWESDTGDWKCYFCDPLLEVRKQKQ